MCVCVWCVFSGSSGLPLKPAILRLMKNSDNDAFEKQVSDTLPSAVTPYQVHASHVHNTPRVSLITGSAEMSDALNGGLLCVSLDFTSSPLVLYLFIPPPGIVQERLLLLGVS